MKRFAFIYLVALFGLLVPALATAQAVSADESATAQQDEAALHEAALYDAARSARLAFSPCPESPTVECGTIDVPVDYRHPRGPKVALAVIRAKALDPGRRIGVLFGHPGGHSAGVDFVLSGLQAPAFNRLRQRFDIVSVDPRGAGRSKPFKCAGTFPEVPADRGDASLIAYFDDLSQRVAQQCLGADRAFVLSISGNNFARDIDVLRRALGEHQLNFGMISNSGPVGAIYASLFPRHVRAMVIDSPVGPDFDDYAIERLSEQSASYETVFAHIDRLCRRDPTCRLRGTGVIAAYDALAAKLEAAPIATPNGGRFDANSLSSAFDLLLPVEGRWPLAVDALANALAGDFTTLIQLANISSTPNRSDAIIARLCNDYGTRRSAADYLPITEAVDAIYPRFFERFALGQRAALCAQWPAADPPIIRDVQRRLATPALLIGSEFDSDAPFPWTKRLANTMGMEPSVLRYQGGGHVLTTRSDLPCVAEVIDAYLVTLQLPAKGARCAAKPIVFSPAAVQAAKQRALEPASTEAATVRRLR
jgi:pimeloyl-ACP methyl ester carboxylesterase